MYTILIGQHQWHGVSCRTSSAKSVKQLFRETDSKLKQSNFLSPNNIPYVWDHMDESVILHGNRKIARGEAKCYSFEHIFTNSILSMRLLVQRHDFTNAIGHYCTI